MFAGVWRIGSGNGALYWMKDWAAFADMKKANNPYQELLDFEMFQTEDGSWNFLGVWRVSPDAGPLHASRSSTAFQPLTADQFVKQWGELKPTHTLVNISVVAPVPALRGDTTCRYGDVDCNRCATNVPDQFKWAFETGHRPWIGWDSRSWKFSGDTKYEPDDSKPEYAFSPYGEGGQVGIASKHVQGFVRTNSSRFPYAGGHSHKTTGSIFIVGRQGDKNVLKSLYRSHHDHPSGVAILGDGLFVAEGSRLRWFDVEAASEKQDHGYDIPKNDPRSKGLKDAGGGLGLAKFHDGTTLLIVSAPGSGFRKNNKEDNLRPRYARFYRLVPDAFHPWKEDGIQFLGEWPHEGISSDPGKPLAYSENLSVVTECETGRIYTIHTTGDYVLKGDGYWRLSRVEPGPGGSKLAHIAIARQSQDNEKCHHRSSATAHVNRNGELEFLCSERAVIKWHPTGKFNFKEDTR